MRLQLQTWCEVEQYLERSTGILVPIGSTEQHGPNGLIGTDALTAEKVALTIGEEQGVLVAPTINVGMAQHHMAFTGSMTLRPSTLIAMIEDIVSSLVRHGFTHLMFINGHGGNVASLDAAYSEIYAKYSLSHQQCPVRCKTVNWYLGKRVSELSRELYGNLEGHHATPSEVAFTYFLYPEHVKEVTLSPEVAPYGSIRDALDYRRQFPDGRIGSNPSLATPADGKRVWRAAVDDVFEKYQGFIGE